MQKSDSHKKILILSIILLFIPLAYAEDNITQETNTTLQETNTSIKEITGETTKEPEKEEKKPVMNISYLTILPKETKVGDTTFNIQVENTGTIEVQNILALVTAKGFATYNTIPVDSLKPGEKSYIVVMGSLKDPGNLTATIRINNNLYYETIQVIDPTNKEGETIFKEIKEEELKQLAITLKELKNNFSQLEKEYNDKKGEYDLSLVSFEELKSNIRAGESHIITKNTEQATISMTLGIDEYVSQKERLTNAKIIKKSPIETIKNNIVIISTIAASLITLFSFYEIMKKKKQEVTKDITDKIKEIKEPKKKTKKK